MFGALCGQERRVIVAHCVSRSRPRKRVQVRLFGSVHDWFSRLAHTPAKNSKSGGVIRVYPFRWVAHERRLHLVFRLVAAPPRWIFIFPPDNSTCAMMAEGLRMSTANRIAVRLASPLPGSRFRRLPDQCFLARRSRFLPETGCSRRPFARPQRFPLPRIPFRGQSSRPAASLPSKLTLLPVRPFCSATESGSPRFRRLRRFWPVAALPAHSTDLAPSLHSPLGVLPPARSKRSTGFDACRPAFRIRPISSRSPQPVSISSVSAADHRSWSATFPEAC
jgi:hypothetical protein